ncbi:hypothetical protein VTN49DRAFT_1594 [Thermomyces lanuginosus]|uniref:uncharacterized protein n=1 Tax=Thermomyces lanuginosus TaxID=5541 RepID=UPI003743EBF1
MRRCRFIIGGERSERRVKVGLAFQSRKTPQKISSLAALLTSLFKLSSPQLPFDILRKELQVRGAAPVGKAGQRPCLQRFTSGKVQGVVGEPVHTSDVPSFTGSKKSVG